MNIEQKFSNPPKDEKLEDLTEKDIMIPPQYKGMSAEVVDELWTIPEYSDPNKTEEEKERKQKVLKKIRETENKKIEENEPEDQKAKDIKKFFENLGESISENAKKKAMEYADRIRAVENGKPLKENDKLEDLKRDFKLFSGVEWNEDWGK